MKRPEHIEISAADYPLLWDRREQLNFKERPTPEDCGLRSDELDEVRRDFERYRARNEQFTWVIGVASFVVAIAATTVLFFVSSFARKVWPVTVFFAPFVIGSAVHAILNSWEPKGNLKFGCLKQYDFALELFAKKQEADRWRAAELERMRKRAYWQQLSGLEFEKAFGDLLERHGHKVRATPATADDGVDIWAEKAGIRMAVQCKRHNKPVGVGAVRELLGAMQHLHAKAGMVAATSGFTSGAREMARAHGIKLVGLESIVRMHKETLD